MTSLARRLHVLRWEDTMDHDPKPRKPPELLLVWGAREPRSSARSAFDRLPVTADQVAELLRRSQAA